MVHKFLSSNHNLIALKESKKPLIITVISSLKLNLLSSYILLNTIQQWESLFMFLVTLLLGKSPKKLLVAWLWYVVFCECIISAPLTLLSLNSLLVLLLFSRALSWMERLLPSLPFTRSLSQWKRTNFTN